MSIKTPPAIATYIAAANAHDPDAAAACFTADAIVKDEGRERQGTAAIRAWKEETGAKYRPQTEVIEVDEVDGRILLTASVSGTFPGSPVTLRYAFVMKDGKIAHLEIVA